MHSSYDYPYIVSSEVELDSLTGRGIKRNTKNMPDGSSRKTTALRCDFMISHPVENDMIFFDVRISHPLATNPKHFSDNAIGAVQEGYDAKYRLYKHNYDLLDGQIIPLVFDVYGNWAPKSREFLRKMIERIAFRGQKVISKLANRLEADLRFRVATTLVTMQHRVISHFVWRLRASAPPVMGSAPPGEVCEEI